MAAGVALRQSETLKNSVFAASNHSLDQAIIAGAAIKLRVVLFFYFMLPAYQSRGFHVDRDDNSQPIYGGANACLVCQYIDQPTAFRLGFERLP